MNRLSIVAALVAVALTFGFAANQASACDTCCKPVCCCPPPPIQVELCVKAPCCCVGETVCVCVPACCTEAPCVTWSKGILGRCVATYCWPCCGHEVKVVVNRRGKVVRVRD